MAERVDQERRFIRGRTCPVCGGQDKDPRGTGKRCFGYLSSDREYVYCSREEHAGGIDQHKPSACYPHKLYGECRCGVVHNATREDIEETYDYCDEHGNLRYQVVRKPGKQFRQRRPSPDGDGWVWNLDGVKSLPYRYPQLLSATESETVFVVEGEKDVNTLASYGLVATTNSGGAGKWPLIAKLAGQALTKRRVVVIPDNDDRGRDHAQEVVTLLNGYPASLSVLELPQGKDVTDYIRATSIEAFLALAGTGKAEDPWKAELAKALADVKAKLRAFEAQPEPLFDLDAVDLLGRVFFGTRWLVTGLITRGSVAMIGGEPKAAIKTWSATEIAVAIATGTSAFGQFQAEIGNVVYFYAEDLDVQVRNRTRALLAGANRTLGRGRFYLRPRGVFIDAIRDEDLAWIVASVRKIGQIALLVLDPMRDIHSGAEDKSDSMYNVMRRFRVLAELLGCAVLVVHHAVKQTKDNAGRNAGQNFRGSSGIHGALDALLDVRDSEGDGSCVFRNNVTSQVKGARSAGTFKLRLAIEDNADGEAIKATWTVDKPKSKGPTSQAQEDDAYALAFVARLSSKGIHLTRRKLRGLDECFLPDYRMRSALDRLLMAGRLELNSEKEIVLPKTADGKDWNDFAGVRGAPKKRDNIPDPSDNDY